MSQSNRILQPITNPEIFIFKIKERIEKDIDTVGNYFYRPICQICMEDKVCNEMPLKCSHKLCKVCYFEIDSCPFCREPYKETVIMDLSNKYDLTYESASKPLLTKWSRCNIWEIIKVVEDFHKYLSQPEIDDTTMLKYSRRINVYLNRHLFVKKCFVINGEIFVQWIDCITGIVLKDLYHMTDDNNEMDNLFGSLLFLTMRLQIYNKEKLGILKKHHLIPDPKYFKKY